MNKKNNKTNNIIVKNVIIIVIFAVKLLNKEKNNMEIIHLDETNFEEIVRKEGKVLVDFYATWCPPCKMLGPILEELANSDVDFQICKLDIDKAMDITSQFGVMSVPTMILFVDGVEVDRMVGFHNKAQILEFTNR